MESLVYWVWNILQVVLAFSALIFFHELGHFLAARAVGVRVERFFLGFDFGGWGLKFKWGDVVYGIGVFPFGGYVKMAGQSDDPSVDNITGAPDELVSKPLWAQALVFAAGPIMNMLFGFLLLMGWYYSGAVDIAPVVGAVQPNAPAAKSGLKAGDEVIAVDDARVEFFEDIQSTVAINASSWTTFTIRRKGEEKPLDIKMKGVNSGMRGINVVGIAPPKTNEIHGVAPQVSPVEQELFHKLIKELRAKLKPGDRVVKVDDMAIDPDRGPYQIHPYLARKVGKMVTLTIERPGEEAPRTVEYGVIGQGFFDIGIAMYVLVKDVVEGSPGAKAGLRAGDKIIAVLRDDSEPQGGADADAGAGAIRPEPTVARDMYTAGDLIEAVGDHAYNAFEITFLRDGARRVARIEKPRYMGARAEIPKGEATMLGVAGAYAYGKGWVVETVLPHGPAGGVLQPGDAITHIGPYSVMDEHERPLIDLVSRASIRPIKLRVLTIDEGVRERSMQPRYDPRSGHPRIGVSIESTFQVAEVRPDSVAADIGIVRGDFLKYAFRLSPETGKTNVIWVDRNGGTRGPKRIDTPPGVLADPADHGFQAVPAIFYRSAYTTVQADSALHAAQLASGRTLKMSTMIYRLLQKLLTREVSAKVVSSPIMIVTVLSYKADEGPSHLIKLVALISINLAIFNLLPIPILDGGHLLFLLIHAVKGSPLNAKAKEYALYAGLFCLLSLLLYAMYNDVAQMLG